MISCPRGAISQEPDRNSKSLLTVYLMAFCSRPTCALSAARSCFRAAISVVAAAFCAADDCCSCVYWPCRLVYWPCRLVYRPCRSLYWPCRSLYLPFETHPERRTEAMHTRRRTLRFSPRVIMVRSPSETGKKTRLPRKLRKCERDAPMLWFAQHNTIAPLRIGKKSLA